jgi:hypothetical protein
MTQRPTKAAVRQCFRPDIQARVLASYHIHLPFQKLKASSLLARLTRKPISPMRLATAYFHPLVLLLGDSFHRIMASRNSQSKSTAKEMFQRVNGSGGMNNRHCLLIDLTKTQQYSCPH